jgi:AcrR family transcriptional regulator
VYEAALHVFRREGVAAARIDDITARAGVSRGTFYFHFPTREDVLRELLAESQRDLAAHLGALPAVARLDEVLRTTARSTAARWRDEPELLAAVGAVAMEGVRGNLDHLGTEHPALAALLPRVRTAAERGEVDARMPPELVSALFLVDLFAALLLWSGNPSLPLDDLLDGVVVFFQKAVSPG